MDDTIKVSGVFAGMLDSVDVTVEGLPVLEMSDAEGGDDEPTMWFIVKNGDIEERRHYRQAKRGEEGAVTHEIRLWLKRI